MDRGTVKWCDAVKGIGFRALDRDGNRVSIQSASTECCDAPAPQPLPKPPKPRKRKQSPEA